MAHPCVGALAALLTIASSPAWGQQGRTRAEVEPNNSVSTATLITLGDTVTGVVNPAADVDYLAFDAPANANIQIFIRGTPSICLTLFDVDGTTPLSNLGCYRDKGDLIRHVTTRSGRYVIFLGPYEQGNPALEYTIEVGVPAPGPGDPPRLIATGLGATEAMTTAPAGGVYVVDNLGTGGWRLSRVALDGTVSRIATGGSFAGGLATDGFGDLLMSTYDDGAVVWRFSPTGVRTRFAQKPAIATYALQGITVGPDGDVWMADPSGNDWSRIWRFDPLGNVKDTIHIGVGRVFFVEMSPAGELHFTTQTGEVYKLVDNQPKLVIPASPSYSPADLWGAWEPLVFDRDGWMYALRSRRERPSTVVLFDPQYRIARNPLALVIDAPIWEKGVIGQGIAFAANSDGSMTSRLFVARTDEGWDTRPLKGSIVELNPSGMGAAGARVAPKLIRLELAANRTGSVGAAFADTVRMPGAPGPVVWTMVAGRVPPGITLSTTSGALGGVPTDTGSFEFSVRGTSGGRIGYGRFNVSIGPAGSVSVSAADIVNALMGGMPLTAAQIQFVDSRGNKNGMLDVGDLRAYLRSQGQLTATQP